MVIKCETFLLFDLLDNIHFPPLTGKHLQITRLSRLCYCCIFFQIIVHAELNNSCFSEYTLIEIIRSHSKSSCVPRSIILRSGVPWDWVIKGL